jgi:hypothetical protein
MSESQFQYAGPHPDTLASGRPIGSGDVVELSVEEAGDPHNKRLIDEGLLVAIGEQEDVVLKGDALEDRIRELGIEGASGLSADAKRAAVAEAERRNEGGSE